MRTALARVLAAGVLAGISLVGIGGPAAAHPSDRPSTPEAQPIDTCWAAATTSTTVRPPELPSASLWMCNGPASSREYGLGSLVWWGPDWGEPGIGSVVRA